MQKLSRIRVRRLQLSELPVVTKKGRLKTNLYPEPLKRYNGKFIGDGFSERADSIEL